LALRLEMLLYRDGHTMREAIEVLRATGGTLPTDAELYVSPPASPRAAVCGQSLRTQRTRLWPAI
jgi:hypothetical protein